MRRRTFIGSVLGGIGSLLVPWRSRLEPEEIVWTKGEGTITLDGPRKWDWIGTDGDWADERNWACPNAVGIPGRKDTVTITIPKGKTYTVASPAGTYLCSELNLGGEGTLIWDAEVYCDNLWTASFDRDKITLTG